ncbi:MAG: TIGR04076 family protein [Myxococcota bacterium]
MNEECFNFEKLLFEVEAVENGGCCSAYKPGDRFSIESIVPEKLCPFLYHTTIPSIEAAKNNSILGGSSDNSIITQCPNPNVGVALKVSSKDEDTVLLKYEQKTGPCPHYQFDPGVKWELSDKTTPFCPRAYDALFPYLNAASTNKKLGISTNEPGFRVTCPNYPGYVVFREIK